MIFGSKTLITGQFRHSGEEHNHMMKAMQYIITAIYEIVNLAHEERDWATFDFAQWFVKEPIEE